MLRRDNSRNFNHQTITELKETFSLIDSAGDGYISMEDFKKFIFRFDMSLNEERFIALLKECNFEKLTSLTFPQFFVVLSTNAAKFVEKQESNSADAIRSVFVYFDQDSSGYLSEGDFMSIMTEKGSPLSAEEAGHLRRRITEAGLLKDGMVNYVSFVNLITEQERNPFS